MPRVAPDRLVRPSSVPPEVPIPGIDQCRGQVANGLATLLNDVSAVPVLLPGEFDCGGLVAGRVFHRTLDDIAGHTDNFRAKLRLPLPVEGAVHFGRGTVIPRAILQHGWQLPRLLDPGQTKKDFFLDLATE